jgi:hypothetical protein
MASSDTETLRHHHDGESIRSATTIRDRSEYMPKITRYEFMESTIVFWLLCLTIVMIPVAIVYLVNGTIRIEHEVDEPEEFVEQYRSGKLTK